MCSTILDIKFIHADRFDNRVRRDNDSSIKRFINKLRLLNVKTHKKKDFNLRLVIESHLILHDNTRDSLYSVVEFSHRIEQVKHCYYEQRLCPGIKWQASK